MGHFGRRASMRESNSQDALISSINALFSEPEDTVLGPPKLSFTSASRAAKAAENSEKRGITSIDGDHLGDRFPSQQRRGERWTRDREGVENPLKNFANGRRVGKEEGEGWTNVKGRKSLGQEDFDRGFGRNGDRDKLPKEGDADGTDGPARRTGTGREKFERWGRRDDNGAKEDEAGGTRKSWRDRERDRERDRDRDWTRGSNKIEEDPEWLGEGAGKEKKQAHTQEEFQRWKEQMKAKDTPAVEKDDQKADTPANAEPPVTSNIFSTPAAKPAVTPSAIENPGIFFGNWGKEKATDNVASAAETITAKPKPDKKSRFMTMFAKPEEAAAPIQPPLPTPASPGIPPPGANGSNDEDKQGFQRILQMLGGVNIAAPSAQPGPTAPVNGPRAGGIPLELHPQSPPEERPGSRPRQQASRTQEQQAMLENILAPKPSAPESRHQQARFNAMSPDNQLFEQLVSRPESNRPMEEHLMPQPPSRNSSAQDANLHALLNSRAREEGNRDPTAKQRERDFLLTLMQQPNRGTPPQATHPGRGPPEHSNMAFFDQGLQRPPPQSKARVAPPGFMEDPRFMIDNDMMRREQQLREQQLHTLNLQQQQHDAMRAKNSRMHAGFNPNSENPMLGRRNTAGEITRDIPRQMTNMGIPSQPVPDMQMFGGRNQGMPPTPQERPNIAPPPGFGGPAAMRQPPGLGGPNGPQQMPSFSAGNTPLGHPPGFGPPGGMRGMFPGAQGQNQMPPQGPPQGYFPPPNYGPMPGLRGEDPRMMMGRPDFDQYGGPGPRQGPRPPNMPY
jgi:hypothetical protein